jgi:uncharacterized protein (TIGR02246 family)
MADNDSSDEQQIRAIIEAWGAASEAGDLSAQLALLTDGVIFLTAGHDPMTREGFIAGFTRMMQTYRMTCHSDIREITISGDMAFTWNHLTIEITPLDGQSPSLRRSGQTLTVFRKGIDGQWRISRDANMLSAVN